MFALGPFFGTSSIQFWPPASLQLCPKVSTGYGLEHLGRQGEICEADLAPQSDRV